MNLTRCGTIRPVVLEYFSRWVGGVGGGQRECIKGHGLVRNVVANRSQVVLKWQTHLDDV